MKKWFMVLCLSFVSALAFAQVDPHTSSQKKFLQTAQQVIPNGIGDKVSSASGLEEFHNMASSLERKLIQAQAKKVQPLPQTDPAQPQTHWPHEDGLTDVAAKDPSDRPSYYAEEEAYKNCNGIEICRTWAAEQAQKDRHFQVLSAIISMPDYHNQHLEVTYVTENAEGKQVFAEDFGKWKKVN